VAVAVAVAVAGGGAILALVGPIWRVLSCSRVPGVCSSPGTFEFQVQAVRQVQTSHDVGLQLQTQSNQEDGQVKSNDGEHMC